MPGVFKRQNFVLDHLNSLWRDQEEIKSVAGIVLGSKSEDERTGVYNCLLFLFLSIWHTFAGNPSSGRNETVNYNLVDKND